MRSLFGLGLLLAAMPLTAAELRDVRVWAGPESTRVVFDLNAETAHKLYTLTGPDRIVIDLPGVHRGDGVTLPTEARGLLQRIRSGIQPDGLRVVLDVSGAVKPKSFVLPPNADYGYRLVVDLFDPQAAKEDSDAPVEVAKETPEEKPEETPKETPKEFPRQITAPELKAPPVLAKKPVAPIEAAPPKVANAPSVRPAPLPNRPIVIAIDAGHGGEDPGAHGRNGVVEKHVALAMSRKLADLINQEPGYKAVLTREGDYYVSLRQRMAKARRAQADLFVSIHANSNRDRKVRGSAVYVLSERGANSEHNRWLAEKENASDLIGGVDIQDKDDTLASVLVDISQASAMEASLDAAGRVLDAIGKVNRLLKPDVQQAAFVVLKAPDMPSMLVETAFISNEKEERQLNDPDYQDELAQRMLDGIKGYFDSYRPSSEQVASSDSRRLLAAP